VLDVFGKKPVTPFVAGRKRSIAIAMCREGFGQFADKKWRFSTTGDSQITQ